MAEDPATIASRGHLNPGDPAVRLERLPVDEALAEVARHVWVGRWQVPAGETRTQYTLTYPGCNAVFTPEEASLYGPGPRVTSRVLTGTSWVVGVLLQPAAAVALTPTAPRVLVGKSEPLTQAPWRDVRALMDEAPLRPAPLLAVLESWLAPLAERVDDAGRLANAACSAVETGDAIRTVADLALHLGVAQRTLHRALRARVGLTAKWLIERRRLQDAAATLRERPETPLAALAAELGFTDQAHFTRRYREVIGRTPGHTQRAAARGRLRPTGDRGTERP